MSEQIEFFEASKYEDEYIEVALIDENDNDYHDYYFLFVFK